MTIEPKITNVECGRLCGVGGEVVGGGGLALGEGAQGFEFARPAGVGSVGVAKAGGFAPDKIGAGVAELDPPKWGIDAAGGIVALVKGSHKCCVPKCAQGVKSKQAMADGKRQNSPPNDTTACRRFNSAPSHHFIINTLRGLCALFVPKVVIFSRSFSHGGFSYA